MGTEVAISFNTLRTQLENEKTTLYKIDESIKKIVQISGRYPNDSRSAPRLGGGNLHSDINQKTDESLTKRKHETKTVFSRLSARVHDSDGEGDGDGDNLGADVNGAGGKKPRVLSTVWREMPTRAEVLRAQGGDERSKVRNRRIFGALLGTLQKFKQEEIMLKTKEEKKAQVERKIEEAAKQEKERERKERQALFAERDVKKATIKALEAKMGRVREFDTWECAHRPLANYILTKAKPHVYWLPKKMNDKATEKLYSSKKYHEKFIMKKRQELQDELHRIENRCFGPTKSFTISTNENDPIEQDDEQDDTSRTCSSQREKGVQGKQQKSEKDQEAKRRTTNSTIQVKEERDVRHKRDKFASDANLQDDKDDNSDTEEKHDISVREPANNIKQNLKEEENNETTDKEELNKDHEETSSKEPEAVEGNVAKELESNKETGNSL